MTQQLIAALREQEEIFTEIRHQIHSHPEVGFEEHRTSDLVARLLEEWGYQVHRGLAGTGVVGTLKVGDGQRSLGIRADMDALPMQEASGKPWASEIPGRFHGCGHDGHTTILLCAAQYLAKTRQFNGTLNLIFQPAEELLYGGKVMVEDGLFDLFPCDRIYGLHNMPGGKLNHFYFCDGPMMASADTLHIEVTGVGGHGAMPEYCVDATLVACHIATALQTIVSRNITPFEPVVVTVGSIQAGEAPNIINEKALMKLSVRTLNEAVRETVLQRIQEIAGTMAASFNASASVSHVNGCPVLVNDPQANDFAREAASDLFGTERVEPGKPFMGSEDFAFMLKHHPQGSYFVVGAGDEADRCMVHNPGYDFNDSTIIPAAALWCELTQRYLR